MARKKEQSIVSVMRYIVPFSYQGKSYKDICEKTEAVAVSDSDWKRQKTTPEKAGDIYQYIYHALEGDKNDPTSAGSAWQYVRRNKSDNTIRKLSVMGHSVNIYDAGMYIFKTGIGFFWYELKLDRFSGTQNDLIALQSRLKEMGQNRTHKEIYEIIKKGTSKNISELKIQDTYPDSMPEDGMEWTKLQYMDGDKNIAAWMQQVIVSEDMPANEYWNIKKMDIQGGMIKYDEVRKFSMSGWIGDLLDVLNCELQYYPGRRHSKEPMEALIYSYFAFPQNQMEGAESQKPLEDMAWHLNSGFSIHSMHAESIKQQMYEPFKDACWYAAQEGCGCCVYINTDNQDFLRGMMANRISKDYFIIYILVLYQTYSLLHFAEKIEYALPADPGIYLQESQNYNQELQEIQTEINTFLMKSVHTSVSHVQYQNDVYNYMIERLRIKEDITSLTAGVDFLEELQETQENKRQEMQEKEREYRKQKSDDMLTVAMSLLSVLTVLSAFSDGFGFLAIVHEAGGLKALLSQSIWNTVVFVGILAAFMIVIVVVASCVKRLVSNKK